MSSYYHKIRDEINWFTLYETFEEKISRRRAMMIVEKYVKIKKTFCSCLANQPVVVKVGLWILSIDSINVMDMVSR